MTKRVVGIDLGTTNSVVAYVDEAGIAHAISNQNGARILPSAVWFLSDEPGKVEIGELARRHRVIEPDAVATLFKRGMGRDTFLPSNQPFVAHGKPWRPEELSSLIIKKLVSTAEEHLSEQISDVVVTVPAYFGESERAATRLAGEMADLNVHLLPAEPMAAAVAHGLEEKTDASTVLVFDLGGGTFDVTILRKKPDGSLEAVAHNGDRMLGGADFDQLILGDMAQKAAAELGADLAGDPNDLAEALQAAEKIKKDLSSRDSAEAALIVGGGRLRYSLTRAELESLLGDHIRDTELTVESALDIAELTKDDIDEVLMVGGSSRIPAFKQMLTDYFGKEPLSSKNLDEDVARGAALMGALHLDLAPQGSALSRLQKPVDRSSHAIGVTVLNDQGLEENAVVLPSNTPIPTPSPVPSRQFGCATDNQTDIELIVNEGDDSNLQFVDRLGTGQGSFNEPKPRGYPIDVQMSLNSDGILSASAFDGVTGQLVAEVKIQRDNAMSALEQQAAEQAIDNIVVL